MRFVKSSEEGIKWEYGRHKIAYTNHPVNLDLVNYIKRRPQFIRVGGEVKHTMYRIEFYFASGIELPWVYNDEKARDKDYEKITL